MDNKRTAPGRHPGHGETARGLSENRSPASLALPGLAVRINAEHEAAEHHARTAVEHAIECGRLLTEAKAQAGHGAWLPWLEEHVTATHRTAQRYMRLAENATRVSHFTSVREALGQLTESRWRSGDDDSRLPSDRDTWSTPDWILDAARAALGGIDLDPATNQYAVERVGAARFFTVDDDGLEQPWGGRVWLNPPYSDIGPWVEKLTAERSTGSVSAAIMLLPQLTGAAWATRVLRTSTAIWFPDRRIGFVNPESGESIGGNSWGNVGAYFGDDLEAFLRAFSPIGEVWVPAGGAA